MTAWIEVLTAKEVATLVRVHDATFYKWCREGKGPTATVLNGRPRYLRTDVQDWLDANRDRLEHAQQSAR